MLVQHEEKRAQAENTKQFLAMNDTTTVDNLNSFVRHIIHFALKSPRNNIINAKHIIIIILHLFIFAIWIIRSFIRSFIHSFLCSEFRRLPFDEMCDFMYVCVCVCVAEYVKIVCAIVALPTVTWLVISSDTYILTI